jgi:hypothetical protein
MSTVRRVCRNVKRWRSASMAMRWTAAAMLEAARGFRRLKAHKQLPTLRAALEAHHKTHTASLLAKPTPLNINFGSDFAMFNKQAGHPEGTQSDLYKVLFACVRMNRDEAPSNRASQVRMRRIRER